MAELSLEQKFEQYKKKAEQGDADAQCNLGYCYEVGNGTTVNYNLAFKWYKASAKQGHRIGKYNLGLLYYKGYGVEKNYSKALKYFKAAAKSQHAGAIYMLGLCYELGNGVDKNLKTALSYYKKASQLNDKKAKEKIPKIESKIQESKKPVRVAGIIALVWAVLSVGFLAFSLITSFNYFNGLSMIRTDFVKYVLVGGVKYTFLLTLSLFGIGLIPILPELLKGETKKNTMRKLTIITIVIAVITLMLLISLPDFSLKTHGGTMFVTFLVEALVAIYVFLVAEDTDTTQLGYGLLLTILGMIFLFFLTSYLKAIGRGFLSVLTGIPVVIMLASPILYIISVIVEKITGNPIGSGYSGTSNYSGSSSNYSTTPTSNYSSTPSTSSPPEDDLYYHCKTEVRSTTKGAPYKGIIGDRQDYDVEITFTFKNSKGKEKTITKSHAYTGGSPLGCDFRPSDAEYQYGYLIREPIK